jgi:hypothetical protein
MRVVAALQAERTQTNEAIDRLRDAVRRQAAELRALKR